MKDNSNPMLSATAEIVSSYLMNHKVDLNNLEDIVTKVHTILSKLEPSHDTTSRKAMAVSVEKSITAEHIICLEDGKPLKMLKRYLKNNYDLTPEEYRKKWGLPASYPMVAPNYAKKRSRLAKQIGLGKQKASENKNKIKYTKPMTSPSNTPAESHV